MFEECECLADCEKVLSNFTQDIDFIGQIDFSEDDIRKLEVLIKRQVEFNPYEYLNYLRSLTPSCLALYMVGKGIWEYSEGEYWSKLGTGLPNIGTSSIQQRLGGFFIRYLQTRDLKHHEFSASYRYINLILLQGGIPQHCFYDFFYLVRSIFVNRNLTEPIEVHDELQKIRSQEIAQAIEREAVENKRESLRQDKRNIEQTIQKLVEIQGIKLRKTDLVEKCKKTKDFLYLPEDIPAQRSLLQQEIIELEETIRSLQQKKNNLIKKTWCYQLAEEQIITRSPQIHWYQKNLPKVRALQNRLHDSGIRQEAATADPLFSYNSLQNCVAVAHDIYPQEISEVIAALQKWYSQIISVARTVNVNTDMPYEAILQALLDKLEDALAKRDQAVPANDQLSYSVEPLLKKNRESLFQRKTALEIINKTLLELGQGSIDLGIEIMTDYRSAPQELQEVSFQLQQKSKNLEFSPHDSQEIEKLLKSCCIKKQELAEEIVLLSEKLETLSPLLGSWDEPIRRFLIYGGQWAEDWVHGVVSLYLFYLPGEGVPEECQDLLPQRVIDGFHEWKIKQQDQETTVKSGTQDKSLNSPYLLLDTTLLQLKIIIPSQTIPEDISCLQSEIILRYNNTEQAAQLPFYRQSTRSLTTNSQEFIIEKFAPQYEVLFKYGSKHQSWEIKGFRDEVPFFCFQESGQAYGNEVISRRCWIMLRTGFHLQDDRQVIEEKEIYLAGEQYRLLLMDLQHTTCLKLIDAAGSYLVIPCAAPHQAPRLSGGKIVPLVHTNGEPVYEEHPSLIIPFHDESGPGIWEIRIYEIASQKGWHLSYDQLKEQGLCSATGQFILPLDMSRLIDEETFGIYKLHLESKSNQSYYSFYLNLIPELLVSFEPEILPPGYDRNENFILTLILPEGHKITYLNPGELLIQEDDAYEYRIEPSTETVDCRIANRNGKQISLVITVPRVRWHLTGNENLEGLWSDQVGCFCFDNLRTAHSLFLEIGIPPHVADLVIIHHPDSKQEIAAQIKSGMSKINILAFIDTLAQLKLTQATTELQLRLIRGRKCICQSILWQVSLQWRVFYVRWECHSQSPCWKIDLRWQNEGKTINGSLLLQSIREPWREPLSFPIESGATSLQININKSALPPGKYLTQFVEVDPWDGTATPDPGTDRVEIVLSDQRLFLKELWTEKNSNQLTIRGKFNKTTGQAVQVILMGIKEGEPRAVIKDVTIDHNGCFTAFLDQAEHYPGRNWCRWVGVVAGEERYSHFSLLDHPAPLELNFTKNLQEFLQKHDIAFPLKFHGQDKTLSYITLPESCSRRIINNPNQTIEDRVSINNKEKAVQFKPNDSGDYTISLESSVRCSGCGKIFPNQKAWYEHSNPYKHPGCRGLNYNFSQIKASLYLSWNINLLSKLRTTHPFLKQLVIYDSVALPVPDFPQFNNIMELDKHLLTARFLQREKQLITIWKGRL